MLLVLVGQQVAAQTIRIATYNAQLSAQGPGLMLQGLQRADAASTVAVVQVIKAVDADILLITNIDYDARGEALDALAQLLDNAGISYPYRLALRPNTGIASGLDLDSNGRFGESRDALGYGQFAGQGGIAMLSRLPIQLDGLRNLNDLKWISLAGNHAPPDTPASLPLSTTGHWMVPVQMPDGSMLTVLAYYATPPVFDGPEDRNGRRNQDETALWSWLLAGQLAEPPPKPPFVIIGQSNLDPVDGEGRREAIRALIANPALQDPAPKGTAARQDVGQQGDATLDTALYDKIGGLRVEVILPSADLKVSGAGVLWPPDDEDFAETLKTASRHHPLWVEITPPP